MKIAFEPEEQVARKENIILNGRVIGVCLPWQASKDAPVKWQVHLRFSNSMYPGVVEETKEAAITACIRKAIADAKTLAEEAAALAAEVGQ
jgi:hypothetical protein